MSQWPKNAKWGNNKRPACLNRSSKTQHKTKQKTFLRIPIWGMCVMDASLKGIIHCGRKISHKTLENDTKWGFRVKNVQDAISFLGIYSKEIFLNIHNGEITLKCITMFYTVFFFSLSCLYGLCSWPDASLGVVMRKWGCYSRKTEIKNKNQCSSYGY